MYISSVLVVVLSISQSISQQASCSMQHRNFSPGSNPIDAPPSYAEAVREDIVTLPRYDCETDSRHVVSSRHEHVQSIV